jgi:hypothetical protein
MTLLLRVSLSLISVQIAQYVAFASARAHSVGDLTPGDQIEAGEAKYKELLKNSGLMGGFFTPGDNLQKANVIGNFNDIYQPAPGGEGSIESGGLPFVGARVQIKLKRLLFTIPFMGRTADADEDFATHVTAMQFREPSNEECRRFFSSSRYELIRGLDHSRFSHGSVTGRSTEYVPLEDSGC